MEYPYYDIVPKTLLANIEFRKELVKLGCESKENAEELWIMCARDILFYINSFCWTYDPRITDSSRTIPFITYPFQDDTIKSLMESFCKENVVIEKTRTMGASWMVLTIAEWGWQFREDFSALLGARVEDDVDNAENPKALFCKLNTLIELQPKWLQPEYKHNHMLLVNYDNNSVLTGESTNPNFARGGRYSMIYKDEEAFTDNCFEIYGAVSAATKSTIYTSTPNGTENVFYNITHPPSSMKKITLHWPLHPEYGAGLYSVDKDGKLDIVDKGYQFPEGYEFILDGKYPFRSPWFDNEFGMHGWNLRYIAQEYEIDYHGSGGQFFENLILNEAIEKCAKPPVLIGNLKQDEYYKVDKFEPHGYGALKLWFTPGNFGRVPLNSNYIIGCDVAAGTGGDFASNSAICVYRTDTKEKVAELASNVIPANELADEVYALAYWFSGTNDTPAKVIWEDNGGTGLTFNKRLVDYHGFRNIYYRKKGKGIHPKDSNIPGWWSDPAKKYRLLLEYKEALAKMRIINRSEEAIEECRQFIWLPGGNVGHSSSRNSIDPSGAKHNHGDRVIADSLCWMLMKDLDKHNKIETQKKHYNTNTWIGRIQYREKMNSKKRSWR